MFALVYRLGCHSIYLYTHELCIPRFITFSMLWSFPCVQPCLTCSYFPCFSDGLHSCFCIISGAIAKVLQTRRTVLHRIRCFFLELQNPVSGQKKYILSALFFLHLTYLTLKINKTLLLEVWHLPSWQCDLVNTSKRYVLKGA